VISKCLLRLRRTKQWQWGSYGMPGLPVSLLRAAGVFPLTSMGFGSSPCCAVCLFWKPFEDKNTLSMAALSFSLGSAAPCAPCCWMPTYFLNSQQLVCFGKLALVLFVAMFSALYKQCCPSEEMP